MLDCGEGFAHREQKFIHRLTVGSGEPNTHTCSDRSFWKNEPRACVRSDGNEEKFVSVFVFRYSPQIQAKRRGEVYNYVMVGIMCACLVSVSVCVTIT